MGAIVGMHKSMRDTYPGALKVLAGSMGISALLAGLLLPNSGAAADTNAPDIGALVLIPPVENAPTTSSGSIYSYRLRGVSYSGMSFLVDGTFTPNRAMTLDYVLVGGGGGGGLGTSLGSGGGGGGGEVKIIVDADVLQETYAIDVGDGGTSGNALPGQGGDGKSSSITGIGFSDTVAGGGGGGAGTTTAADYVGRPGATGGGAGSRGLVGSGGTASALGAGAGGGASAALNGGGGGGGGAGEGMGGEDPIGVRGLSTSGGNGGYGVVTEIFNDGSTPEGFGGGGGGGVALTGTAGTGPMSVYGPLEDTLTYGGADAVKGSLAWGGVDGTGGGGGGGGKSGTNKSGGTGGVGTIQMRYLWFPESTSSPATTTLDPSTHVLAWSTPEYKPFPMTAYTVIYRVHGTSAWNTYARSDATLPNTFVMSSTLTGCQGANSAAWTCILGIGLGGGDLTAPSYDVAVFGRSALRLGQIATDNGITTYTP